MARARHAARKVAETDAAVTADDVLGAWPALAREERLEAFRGLSRLQAEDVFFGLSGADQAEIVLALAPEERRSWMRLLAPDDAADVIQASPLEERGGLLALLDDQSRVEVTALLAYAEDAAGGLMNPRYARLRRDMTVDEAIAYLRRQAREHLETIYYAYVLDENQRLVGVVSFRDLFGASPGQRVRDVMRTELVTAPEEMDQEELSHLFEQNELLAIPVVDRDGHMKGIVTVDDIVTVVEEEATEDIQKIGGSEALDAPYLTIRFSRMIRKRAVWLLVLFFGEMLTASAMGYFEDEIARAVVLALFVPLIISSGGNSGSQASTLVIRAMALGEVRLREWWKVVRRELAAGLVLGVALGLFGVLRIYVWERMAGSFGEHWPLIALTLGASLVCVVTFGTVAGSMLPFLLRRLGLDPAIASAPLVATVVDVTGLVIYFTVAALLMRGTLL